MQKQKLAALLVLQFVLQFALLTAGQNGHTDDAAVGIRNAVKLYMSPDPAKVKEAFYASANLYTADGKGGLRIIPVDQFLSNIEKGGAPGQGRPPMSVDFIDRVGSMAIVRLTEMLDRGPVVDYLSLVLVDAGWKIVGKTFGAQPQMQTGAMSATSGSQTMDQNLCEKSEVRAFDYMIGNWITSTTESTGDQGEGVTSVKKMLNGCVLWQHRYQEQAGREAFDAQLTLGYDVTTSRMRLFIVDDRSRTQVFDGAWENGGWVFYREQPGDAGQMVLIRVIYSQRGEGFTQTAEVSKNRGKNWETLSVTTYKPQA
jgi:hypothetical protein